MSMGGEQGFGGNLGMMPVDMVRGWSPSYSQVTSRDENVSYGGGVRSRLIYDSLWQVLNSSFTALGWFQPTIFSTPPGTKKYRPVTFLKTQQSWDEEVAPNTMAFVPENMTDRPWEIGSEFYENRWIFYLDIFGDNEDISLQLAGDAVDILRGKLTAIGRGFGPMVDICDWSQPGHYKIGYLYIENVTDTRAPTYSQRWMRYLRTVRWEACDYYDQDVDNLGVGRAHWGFEP